MTVKKTSEKKGRRKKMSIAKKLKQIRYPLLIMWGILLGAAGTAGVKSSGHVLPTWIIWAIVILGVIVMFVWIASIKLDKRERPIENKNDSQVQNHSSEIAIIEKVVTEPIELEFWGKRNGVDYFSAKSISGWDIPNDHILLIGFDGSTPRDVGMDAVVTGKDHMEYFGKIEMLYCKKRSGVSGTEKLKTEKFVKKTFSREQWEKGTEEISILEVLKE